MQGLFGWLETLPTGLLYLMLAAVAAVENIFPPVPADTVVAFGSFLAARGQGTMLGAFLSTFLGNLAGAMAMYWVGRRYGGEYIERHFGGHDGANQRLRRLYGKYGMGALFVSRFLPGVRALVPPFAGALKLPAVPVAIALGSASALWYGVITVLAFRIGNDWEALTAKMSLWRNWLLAGAGILLVVAFVAWLVMRRRSRPAA